ncbi:MAG: phytoene desaturase, partial [Bacteroidales bacterium]|nr:phytoene desaturase [Bacteroidales bacterium]
HLGVLFRNFYQQLKLHFSSKEVRQILSLVAFFLGRTPFDTMAVYTLLSHTEFRHNGYYNVEGGMYAIVEGLLRELEKENIKINYNTEIISYKEHNGKLEHFIDNQGQNWKADLYLVNGDAAVFRGKVLDRKKYSTRKLDKMSWTMGYLTFYLGVKTKLPQVDHHNYYLGSNFEDYARKVQQDPGTLQKPYYYVNVVSKYNQECAPEGCESLFFVCPVPNLLQKPDWSDKDKIVDSIIEDFSGRIGQDIKPEIISKTIYTPQDWEKQFHLHRGTGLGLSHKMLQIGAFRPSNIDENFKNVFYAGASTVPGAGLPMGIISSKLAVERMLNYKAE